MLLSRRPPHLQTPRLDIVPLEVAHAALMFPGMNDPALFRYMELAAPASLAALETTFRRYLRGSPSPQNAWWNWTLFARESPPCAAGSLQLTIEGTSQAHLGYWLLAPFRKRGLAKEACEAVLRYLCEQTLVERAVATADARNRDSIAVLESLGFERSPSEPRGPDLEFAKRLKRG